MPQVGYIADRGLRGIEHKDKPLALRGGSTLQNFDEVGIFEDFVSDSQAEATHIQINQSGTAVTAADIGLATAGAPTAGHGGWIAGATDDVDAEIDEVALATIATAGWYAVARAGNGLAVAECGLVIPTALTTRQYFFGVTDDPTEGTGTNGALNIQADTTLTSVATDAAGFIFSSLATDADGWYAASVNGDSDGSVIAPLITGVVDDYTRLRVEIDSAGNCYFYAGIHATNGRSGVTLNYQGQEGEGVATTALLCPIFSAAPTTTTSVGWEVDYMVLKGPA